MALIEGICVGGSLELACMADLRICGAFLPTRIQPETSAKTFDIKGAVGESSRFGVPVNRLGLVMALPEVDVRPVP